MLPIFTPEPWTEAALCAQTDPEAFFPEKGGSSREAKSVCAVCDVRDECLAYALEHDERFGIWGGLSERQRRALKKNTTTTTEEDTTTMIPVEEVPDFEVCEGCFGSFDPAEVDKAGLCDVCAIAPAPKDQVRLVGRAPLPGWAADAAALLVATEGHQDPLVRDVRKVAAQSLRALHSAKAQYDRLASSADRAISSISVVVNARDVDPKTVAADVKRAMGRRPKEGSGKRDPLATTVLMKNAGTTPAEVRAWAKENGIDVADRGNPSLSVIQQYLEGVTTTTEEKRA